MQNFTTTLGQMAAVLGCQWGDEGKGKLVDILSAQYDIIVRATGGANAGHTVYIGQEPNVKKFIFHLMPSGILHEGKICVIGNGLVVHLPTLISEIETLKSNGISVEGRLKISDRAHLLFEYHKLIDGLQEERKGLKKVGTTMRGIGPCYADKINRIGIRVSELYDFDKFSERLRANVKILQNMYGGFKYDTEKEISDYKKIAETVIPFITDTSFYLNEALTAGKTVLLEGANGAMLDIDHGTYPFVTSSNPTIGGVLAGLGVASQKLNSVIGILKAYCTRVGAGPFPTELTNKTGEKLREVGNEFGATTGRPRRCGWFDTVIAKYAIRLNGLAAVNLTKIDVLSGISKIKIGVSYLHQGRKLNSPSSALDVLGKCEVEYFEMEGWDEDISKMRNFEELPENCKKYISKLEEIISCPIKFIGVGQRRDQMIIRER